MRHAGSLLGGLVLVLVLSLVGGRAYANQANTINADPDAGNGTANCTAKNTDNSDAHFYLSGLCVYTYSVNPMTSSQTVTFDVGTNCETASVSRGDGYVDAGAAVQWVIYKYDVTTLVQSPLNIRGENANNQVPAGGQDRYITGAGAFTIQPWTQERMRYKVRGGYFNGIGVYTITGGAWTGDLH